MKYAADEGARFGSIEPSADAAVSARVHADAVVWHLAQTREHTVVGAKSVIGRAAYVGPAVRIGARRTVQNAALLYEPAVLGVPR